MDKRVVFIVGAGSLLGATLKSALESVIAQMADTYVGVKELDYATFVWERSQISPFDIAVPLLPCGGYFFRRGYEARRIPSARGRQRVLGGHIG